MTPFRTFSADEVREGELTRCRLAAAKMGDLPSGMIATHRFQGPPPFRWRWFIAPGCYFYVADAPNRFHRWMQRVFLGLTWERVDA